MSEEKLEAPVGMETAAEEAGKAMKEDDWLPKKERSETKLAAVSVSVSVIVGETRRLEEERREGESVVAAELADNVARLIDVEPM